MKYVLMEQAHIEAVTELEKLCFTDPWSIDAIYSELNNPLSLWVVAIDDQCVVGYVGSQSVLGWSDMMNLAVHPDKRKCGIGEQLILTLEKELKARGNSCLTLEVRASNMPAISLYSKLGFSQVGKRPGYYHNPKEDALILRKEWDV